MNAPYRPSEQAEGLTAYRPFIDGLRAVSILAVVLYHVGIPGITGGYVGVDVFFVISGFLIISQIVEGLQRGAFSFGGFWARRALRILPPYLLVLAFTIAAAPFVLVMPEEFKEFGREVGHAAVMVANHFFLSQQGYFDTAVDGKILLHLWSLAVEEQFYLAAPLLLGLLWWLPRWLGRTELRPRLVLWTAAAVFALSLGGCVLFTARGHNYAFYLSALRAWEFVAGGAVGFLLPAARRLPDRVHALLAAAGLVAIVACVFLYTIDTPYPSWRAAVPVFGAVAIILGGLARPGSPAIRLLAAPTMVWVGLVSYAWYLWHWPLLSLARIARFGERDLAMDIAVGLLSLVMAAATFHLVERPIRRWRQAHGHQLGWRPVFAGIAACVLFALAGMQSFSALSKRIEAGLPPKAQLPVVQRVAICDLLADTPQACNAVAAGRPVGLVFGDSHAGSALWGTADFAARHGAAVAALASVGCLPALEGKEFVRDEQMAAGCARFRAVALPLLAGGEVKPDYALMFARWPIYGTGRDLLIGAVDADAPAADQSAAFVSAVRGTLADLRSYGVKRILVIGPTPRFTRLPSTCLVLANRYGSDPAQTCGVARAFAEAEARLSAERLHAAIAGLPGVRYVDPLGDFCNAERCLPYAGDTMLLVDTSHLSDLGTARLIDRHLRDFEWLVGAGAL